jgi:hypothetical protein
MNGLFCHESFAIFYKHVNVGPVSGARYWLSGPIYPNITGWAVTTKKRAYVFQLAYQALATGI